MIFVQVVRKILQRVYGRSHVYRYDYGCVMSVDAKFDIDIVTIE